MKTPLAAVALVLATAGALRAQPAADSARDADVFGAPQAATAPAASDEAQTFGAPDADEQGRLDTASLPGRVAEKENMLAIGGLLYQRLSYAFDREVAAKSAPLSAPSLYDVYFDARPSDRVRAYARGRLRYDFTAVGSSSAPSALTGTTTGFGSLGRAPAKTEGALDQLWLKFDVARAVYLTVGKQPLKWGTGRFWNPTDFLNPQRRDPLAVFDERLGVSLVKVHVPLEKTGSNLYLIADVEDAAAPEQVGVAARAETVLGTAEFSVSGEVRKNRPSVLGADFSVGVWDFDVRGEAAFVHGDKGPFFKGAFDPDKGVLPTPVDRAGEWIPQVVGGVEYAFNYSDEDSVTVGAEYFTNGAGYDNADFYPWLLYSGAFRPLYLGRHYVGGYVFLAGPGDWNDTTLIATTLTNMSDRSYLSRFDYRVLVLTYVSLDAYVNYHYGGNGELNFGLRIPSIPSVPQLASGLHTPQPLIDGGLGLRVAF